jgi:hypothetical protein
VDATARMLSMSGDAILIRHSPRPVLLTIDCHSLRLCAHSGCNLVREQARTIVRHCYRNHGQRSPCEHKPVNSHPSTFSFWDIARELRTRMHASNKCFPASLHREHASSTVIKAHSWAKLSLVRPAEHLHRRCGPATVTGTGSTSSKALPSKGNDSSRCVLVGRRS